MKLLTVLRSPVNTPTLKGNVLLYVSLHELDVDNTPSLQGLSLTDMYVNEVIAHITLLEKPAPNNMPYVPITESNLYFLCEVSDKTNINTGIFMVPEKDINLARVNHSEDVCGVNFICFMEESSTYQESDALYAVENGIVSVAIDEYDMTMGVIGVNTELCENGCVDTKVIAEIQLAFDDYVAYTIDGVEQKQAFKDFVVNHLLIEKFRVPGF